jgi:predicted DCC family thiol-disulfide oxidoreductase YuxK
MHTQPKTQVFYDGDCPLCTVVARWYLTATGADNLEFVNIASPGFDAAAYALDPGAVQRVIHALTPGGKVVCGLDALIAIWSELPDYRLRARLARLPGVHFLLAAGYRLVAANRHWLKRAEHAIHHPPKSS